MFDMMAVASLEAVSNVLHYSHANKSNINIWKLETLPLLYNFALAMLTVKSLNHRAYIQFRPLPAIILIHSYCSIICT